MTEQQGKRVGEQPGDVITALAAADDAGRNPIIFAGSAMGLHASTDGGRSWMGRIAGSDLPLISALAPSQDFAIDQTIFIGTANGCYRSTDGGRSCEPVLVGGQVLAVATEPDGGTAPEKRQARPSIVFVGTETDGVLRSGDGGQSWATVNAGLLDLMILALAFSPDFVRDRTGFVATAAGLYATRNGGKAWRWVDVGLDDPAVQSIAISPRFGHDGLIFAGTEDYGLLRSTDSGATWETVADVGDRSVTAIAFSATEGRAAVATDRGVLTTADAGASWLRQGEDLGPVLCLTYLGDAGREALVAGLVGQGIARSESDGAEWARVGGPAGGK